jgi:hypothetical protein
MEGDRKTAPPLPAKTAGKGKGVPGKKPLSWRREGKRDGFFLGRLLLRSMRSVDLCCCCLLSAVRCCDMC